MLHGHTDLVTLQVPGTWMVRLLQAWIEGDSVEPRFLMRHFNTLTWPQSAGNTISEIRNSNNFPGKDNPDKSTSLSEMFLANKCKKH